MDAAYLKDVVLKFMQLGGERVAEKHALLPVIAAILRFDPGEVRLVQASMQAQSAQKGSVLGGLWGGGGGANAGAGGAGASQMQMQMQAQAYELQLQAQVLISQAK